jgi:cytochrome b involved in lipid metabolism
MRPSFPTPHKVYDISLWNEHPGGSLLFSEAGHDATGSFLAFHPASAYDLLEKFYIGNLSDPVSDIDRDFRALKATIRKMDLHKARYVGVPVFAALCCFVLAHGTACCAAFLPHSPVCRVGC